MIIFMILLRMNLKVLIKVFLLVHLGKRTSWVIFRLSYYVLSGAEKNVVKITLFAKVKSACIVTQITQMHRTSTAPANPIDDTPGSSYGTTCEETVDNVFDSRDESGPDYTELL